MANAGRYAMRGRVFFPLVFEPAALAEVAARAFSITRRGTLIGQSNERITLIGQSNQRGALTGQSNERRTLYGYDA